MRRRLFHSTMIVGLSALTLAGCADDPTTPTNPSTPISVTETFSGTLTVNGAVTFPFASVAGSVNATVTALAPDVLSVIGVSVGLSSGSTCQVVLSNDAAQINSQITGVVRESGTFCARVYDVGKIKGPITFTINVEHF